MSLVLVPAHLKFRVWRIQSAALFCTLYWERTHVRGGTTSCHATAEIVCNHVLDCFFFFFFGSQLHIFLIASLTKKKSLKSNELQMISCTLGRTARCPVPLNNRGPSTSTRNQECLWYCDRAGTSWTETFSTTRTSALFLCLLLRSNWCQVMPLYIQTIAIFISNV